MARAARGKKAHNPNTLESVFGRALRTARQGRSISQEALAAEAGYHRTYIGQIERGEKSPSIRTVFDLAKVLGLRPSLLIADTEDALSA
jgi:transcriptional regulator with XRE-family HTH domain